jgi:hypothetical protein
MNEDSGEGIRRDIERLVRGACTDEALATCQTLLALGPVVYALRNYEDDVLRTHVLRDFLRAVRDHAASKETPEDPQTPVRAAGALIGVDSRNFQTLGARQDLAGGIIKESGRNLRRQENRRELVAAYSDAIVDFIKDPVALAEFDRNERTWITRHMPEPRSDGKILNAVRLLLSSDDPVDRAFLSPLTSGRSDEKAWRLNMSSFYELRRRLLKFKDRLEDAIESARDSPDAWASKSYNVKMVYSGDLTLIRSTIYERVLKRMAASPFDERLENDFWDRLYLVFRASPEPDDGSWLLRLRDPDLWDGKKRKEVAESIPVSGDAEADAAWQEFLVTCHCTPGDQVAERMCGIHVLLRHCETASEIATQILLGQLTDVDSHTGIARSDGLPK